MELYGPCGAPPPLVRRGGFPGGKLRSAGTTGLMPCFLIGTQSCHQGAPSCHQDWPPCANQARVYNRWCITITTTTTTITIIPLTDHHTLTHPRSNSGVPAAAPHFPDVTPSHPSQQTLKKKRRFPPHPPHPTSRPGHPPPHPSKGRERRGRKKGKEEEEGRGREGLRWSP